VVEGKMYILPDFSLKTTPNKRGFLVGQTSNDLKKTYSRLNIVQMFLCFISLTKCEAKINKNCRLMTLASYFVENMQHKIFLLLKYSALEMFSSGLTEQANQKTFMCCFQREIRQNVHFTFQHFCCLLEC
jgi:hypothetical protein